MSDPETYARMVANCIFHLQKSADTWNVTSVAMLNKSTVEAMISTLQMVHHYLESLRPYDHD